MGGCAGGVGRGAQGPWSFKEGGVNLFWPQLLGGGKFHQDKNGGIFLLTVGAFLLTVKLLCLQSLKARIRRAFSHCKTNLTVSRQAKTVSKQKTPIASQTAKVCQLQVKQLHCKQEASNCEQERRIQIKMLA